MNKEQIINWFDDRTPREKISIYVVIFLVTYVLWAMIVLHPVNKSIAYQAKMEQEFQAQIITIQNELTTILQILSDPHFQNILSEEKRLETLTKTVGSRLLTIVPSVLQPEDFPKVMESILKIPANVSLVNIKRLPTEPWIPKELSELHLPIIFASIFKYNVELEFQGNYFDTLDYLKKIEKLPWHIYWNKLDYKVTHYPQADVRVTLNVLVEQKR